MHPMRAVLALLAAVAVLAGCQDDGRTLSPAPTVPVSRETTTTAGPARTAPAAGEAADAMSLSSSAFTDGGLLHETFTCNGTDVPPPLMIGDVPAGTAELAIVVTDRDAGGFVHWAVTGIPPTVTTLEAGLVPPGAVAARTDSGVIGWDGPCPPPGEPAHTYDFVVYAIPEPIGMTPGTAGREAIDIIENAASSSASISAIYASPAGG